MLEREGMGVAPKAGLSARTVLVTIALLGLGCGVGTTEERLGLYAVEVEAALGAQPPPDEISPIDSRDYSLPPRRSRRLELPDERIGPFDFLATIGCPLSELAAERNGPLGRVMVPVRRWAYERRVIGAIDECAATLGRERRTRLEGIAARKRASLWKHTWHAAWLAEPVERYLGAGPAALFGGDRSDDGPRQLRRAARALAEGDVASLEAAQQQLRDDPPAGPSLAAAARSIALLTRVAQAVNSVSFSKCDHEARRVTRVFEHRFVPLRGELTEQVAFSRELGGAVEALFDASAAAGTPSMEMRAYLRRLAGDGTGGPSLGASYRDALVAHARALSPALEACGVVPGSTN